MPIAGGIFFQFDVLRACKFKVQVLWGICPHQLKENLVEVFKHGQGKWVGSALRTMTVKLDFL